MSARHTVAVWALVAAAAATVAVAGCGASEPDQPTRPTAPTTSENRGAPVAAVSPSQAGRIAADRYGGRVLNVEPDTANGEPTWEVEVADSRDGRIEVDISQWTGNVVEMERD